MSTQMEWSQELATGHSVIDEQHKQIIRLLNQLELCLQNTEQRPHLMDTLQQLGECALEHFATEERLMQQLRYPHQERHLQQHALLTEQAMAINRLCLEGTIPLHSDIANELHDWALDHISREDHELGLFLASRPTLAKN